MNKVSVSVAFGGILGLLLLHSAAAATYVVGDSSGWNIPTSNDFYETWAEKNKFVVGDVLTFDFTTGVHDVVEVPKKSYDSCDQSNAIHTYKNGPVNFSLSATGKHYFICSFDGHCSKGQKLAVTVDSTSPMSPASSPSTPSGQGSPPSSAPRVFAGFFSVLFSIALGGMVL